MKAILTKTVIFSELTEREKGIIVAVFLFPSIVCDFIFLLKPFFS